MKFLKDRILPLFMTALLGGLLPACVNEDEGTSTASDDGSFFISIVISAGNASPARAEGDLTDEEGTSSESYININDLKIYAFSVPSAGTDSPSNSKLLAQIYPIDGTVGSTDEENQKMKSVVTPVGDMYYLTAELDPGVFSTEQTFRLVAVANWKTFSSATDILLNENSTLDDLQKLVFSVASNSNTSWIPSTSENRAGIPMFGLETVDLAKYDKKVYNEANPYLLNPVNMLRALAKIEIVDAIKDEKLNISGVSILPYNVNGYLAPVLTGNQLVNTENVQSPRIPDISQTKNDQALSFHNEPGTNIFVAYLPEYAFETNTARDIIAVTISDGGLEEQTYKLSLSPYTEEGKTDTDAVTYPWNALLRNHIYRYIIEGVKQAEKITLVLNYTVCPWATKKSDDIEFY